MSRSFKEVIKNPAMRRWFKDTFSFYNLTDSSSGITANRLVEISSNTAAIGTEASTTIVGMTRSTVAASDADVEVEWGCVPCYLASPVAKMDNIAPRALGTVAKSLASQVTLLAATAGGNFGNQPASDGVTVVSDSTADTTQTCTIYGTKTGALTTVTSETVSLNGTTDADTTLETWVNVVAVKLSASCAGTVEISETSGGAEITSITTGDLSAGVATPSTTNAYGLIPRHDADASATTPIALIGTGIDGTALSVVDALNGTTEEDHATTAYATITEIYLGAVASATDVIVLTNETADTTNVGVALEASTVSGVSKDCWIKPYFF